MSLFPFYRLSRYGYIDKTTKTVAINPVFDIAFYFHEGLARVKDGLKYGFIGESGNYHIKPHFDDAGDFSEGLARVKIERKYGYIDHAGNFIIQPHYESADDFSEGVARVKYEGKFGFIDKSGKFVIKPEFEIAERFSEGLAVIGILGNYYGWKYGFIDKTGKVVIHPQFDVAKPFSGGLSLVSNGMWGYVDKKGKIVIKNTLAYAEPFSEGVAVIGIKSDFEWLYGYIDFSGKLIIEPKFEFATSFSDGLAAVKIGDIPKYFEDSTFEYGVLKKLTKNEDKRFLLNSYYGDKTNKRYFLKSNLNELEKSHIKDIFDMIGYKISKPKYAYINKNGVVVIHPEFDSADKFINGVAKVKVGRKHGYIDKTGHYICVLSD